MNKIKQNSKEDKEIRQRKNKKIEIVRIKFRKEIRKEIKEKRRKKAKKKVCLLYDFFSGKFENIVQYME